MQLVSNDRARTTSAIQTFSAFLIFFCSFSRTSVTGKDNKGRLLLSASLRTRRSDRRSSLSYLSLVLLRLDFALQTSTLAEQALRADLRERGP